MQELIVKQVRRTSSKFSSLNHSSEGSVGCAELLKLNSFMLLAFFYMFNCLSSLAYSDFSWGREIYGGAGGTWVNFCRVCESLPNYSLFLVPFGQICNFRDPNLVTFYFFKNWSIFRLNEEHFIFHLQKHSSTFANRKYEELSYPQKSENVRPHSSNSIENFKRLSLIVRVTVVLNRTVVVDSDWRFDNLCGSHLQSQVVETSVTVNNNSPIQDYVHPDNQTQPTFEMTPGFKPFTIIFLLLDFQIS